MAIRPNRWLFTFITWSLKCDCRCRLRDWEKKRLECGLSNWDKAFVSVLQNSNLCGGKKLSHLGEHQTKRSTQLRSHIKTPQAKWVNEILMRFLELRWSNETLMRLRCVEVGRLPYRVMRHIFVFYRVFVKI